MTVALEKKLERKPFLQITYNTGWAKNLTVIENCNSCTYDVDSDPYMTVLSSKLCVKNVISLTVYIALTHIHQFFL